MHAGKRRKALLREGRALVAKLAEGKCQRLP